MSDQGDGIGDARASELHEREGSQVRVIHGIHEGRFCLAGKKIAEVAQSLREVYNVPENAAGYLNGRHVSAEHLLAAGDNLEFVKSWGQKGGVQEYWSEEEVAQLFGQQAVEEIEPYREWVYTRDQILQWQQQSRSDDPADSGLARGLVVNSATFTVSHHDQGPCFLGNNLNFKLLERLSRRVRFFVHFDKLKRDIWQDDQTSDDTVSRRVRLLRTKLQTLGFTGLRLATQKDCVALFAD